MGLVVRKGRIAGLVLLCFALLLALPLQADETMDEDSVFASIRRYEGLDPADMPEIVRHAAEGFLPIMRASEGFFGYYLLTGGDVLAAVSLFDTREAASASNEAARDFVAENLAPLLPNPPLIAEGPIDVMYVTLLADMSEGMDGEDSEEEAEGEMMEGGDGLSSLYGAMRIYEGFDLARLEESNELVRSILLAIHQEAAGFFGFFFLHTEEGMIGALSIFESEEEAMAINEAAKAFTLEYFPEFAQEPLRANGPIAVAALAAVNEGANLIGEMMLDGEMEEDASG